MKADNILNWWFPAKGSKAWREGHRVNEKLPGLILINYTEELLNWLKRNYVKSCFLKFCSWCTYAEKGITTLIKLTLICVMMWIPTLISIFNLQTDCHCKLHLVSAEAVNKRGNNFNNSMHICDSEKNAAWNVSNSTISPGWTPCLSYAEMVNEERSVLACLLAYRCENVIMIMIN